MGRRVCCAISLLTGFRQRRPEARGRVFAPEARKEVAGAAAGAYSWRMTEKACGYCGRGSFDEHLDPPALFCLPCVLRRIFPFITQAHWRILLGMNALFALLTFLLLLPGALSGHGAEFPRVVMATVLAFMGPFDGALSGGHWTCSSCHAITTKLAGFCGGALAVGLVAQLIPLPRLGWTRGLQLTAWIVGLLAWFVGTIFSVLAVNS